MEAIIDQPPGGPAMMLSGLVADAVGETVSDLFDVAGGMDRNMAVMAGMRAEAIAQAMAWHSLDETGASGAYGSKELRLRSLRAELACVLRVPERTAEVMLVTSEALVNHLPATLAVLKAGEISYRHAQVMVDQTSAWMARRARRWRWRRCRSRET